MRARTPRFGERDDVVDLNRSSLTEVFEVVEREGLAGVRVCPRASEDIVGATALTCRLDGSLVCIAKQNVVALVAPVAIDV